MVTVTINLVGTTSSGKSTVGNFLLGAKLLPVAVQEKTTAITEIVHEEGRKTPLWLNPAPTFECDSVATARAMLERIMEEAGERRRVPLRLAFCTAIARKIWLRRWLHVLRSQNKDQGQSAGERAISLMLRDFPGFRHENHQESLDALQELRQGDVTIMVFDADATNDHLEEAFLQNLLTRHRATNGTLAGLLFVVNKIDAFFRDRHPEESVSRYIEEVRARITAAVRTTGGETTADASPPTVPLVAGAAFHARALLDRPCIHCQDDMTEFRKQMAGHFIGRLDREVFAEQPAKWRKRQWHRAAREILRDSHAETFLQALRSEIRDRLRQQMSPRPIHELMGGCRGCYP